jgi:hypothetical protein
MGRVDEQVRELLVATGAVNGGKVALTSRLFHDLHLDGDDASEFFDAVEKRFGTDLAALYTPWNEHFGPEFPHPFIAAAAGVLVVIVVSLIRKVGPLVITAEAVLLIALIAIAVWVACRAHHRMKPITVGAVVSAVEQGVASA